MQGHGKYRQWNGATSLAFVICIGLGAFSFTGTAAAQQGLPKAFKVRVDAQLVDRRVTLDKQLKLGKVEVAGIVAKWVAAQGIGDKEIVRIFAPKAAARSVFEELIKSYVEYKVSDEVPPWDPWPDKETNENKIKYVACVVRRIGIFWEWKKERFEQLRDRFKKNDFAYPLEPDAYESIRQVILLKYGPFAPQGTSQLDAEQIKELAKLERPCLESGATGIKIESTFSKTLSVAWSAKCLQSDEIRQDGTVAPFRPATAALVYDDGRDGPRAYCTGTLIAPNAVLTAAHCVCETTAKNPTGLFYNRAGACMRGSYQRLGSTLSTLEPAYQSVFFQHAGTFDVGRIVVHPQFSFGEASSFADLAILFLKSDVPNIVPSRINTVRALPPDTPAAAVGYGAHNPIDSSGAVTDTKTIIQATGLKLEARLTTSQCSPYERSRKLICWRYGGGQNDIKSGSTCFGDSGGPLYATASSGETYLVGVTSGGGPSCQPGDNAFDTEVYAFRSWITGELRRDPRPAHSQLASVATQPAASPETEGGLTQLGCQFCPLCGYIDQKVTIPPKGRRLRVSVNCTPDDFSKVTPKIQVKAWKGSGDAPVGTAPCIGEGATASCIWPVQGSETWSLHVETSLLQQCQILATSLN